MKKLLAIILAAIMLASVFAFNASAATETKTVDVKWNFGYVGSSTNSNSANKINPTGSNYSYSDIIDMGPAGSTITFSEDKSAYASNAAYILSFWKKNGEEYVIDTEAKNIPGTNNRDQKRIYSFTTTEDNQSIRISFHSGQTTSYTPFYFPTVYVGGNAVETTWSCGYVGSPTHSNAAYQNAIAEGGSNYSYSGIITVPTKGTVVTFTDDLSNAFASGSAAVFSTWKKDGDNWVYGGTSLLGNDSSIYKDEDHEVVYSYTSTKDNELVRLCYNSGQTAANTPATRPVVTLTYTVADPQPTPDTGDATSVVLASLIAVITLAGVTIGKKR